MVSVFREALRASSTLSTYPGWLESRNADGRRGHRRIFHLYEVPLDSHHREGNPIERLLSEASGTTW